MDKKRTVLRKNEVKKARMLIEKKQKKRQNSCLLLIKGIFVLLCLIGFFFNSYIIFKQFIDEETITSYKIQETPKLYLPSITFCGQSGFKRKVENYSDFELENYINNTVKLSEIVKEVADHSNQTFAKPDSHSTFDGSGKWNIVETYSAYRGRCYTMEYKELVIPRNGILIVFDVDNEFWIYVHDRGEEYYLHYDFWPTVPFIHRSVTNEYFSDIVVRKELEIHQDNCSEENYDYFDCLRKDFKKQLRRKDYNCTLPWIQSMIGEISYQNSSATACSNENDFDHLFLEGLLFSKQIAQYNNSKCPAFCKKATYNVGIQSFDRQSFINIENKDKDDQRAILIYYSTTTIKVSTTSKLISLSSFISSIGGNLGLFVGFSFLSVFFLIYKFLSRVLYRRKKETFIFERIFL